MGNPEAHLRSKYGKQMIQMLFSGGVTELFSANRIISVYLLLVQQFLCDRFINLVASFIKQLLHSFSSIYQNISNLLIGLLPPIPFAVFCTPKISVL